jgi:hypothetical protein
MLVLLCDPEKTALGEALLASLGCSETAFAMQKKIRLGDIFHDKRYPYNNWRVTGEGNGVFELTSEERPTVSRYHTAKTLLDPYVYAFDKQSESGSRPISKIPHKNSMRK